MALTAPAVIMLFASPALGQEPPAVATSPAASAPPPPAVPDHVQQAMSAVTRTVGYEYLQFLPKDYDEKGAKQWPLILFLHGAGERGSNIWKVTRHGPPKNVKQQPDFPFIVISPQCPDGETWNPESVIALLDHVVADLKIDRSRIYLTGISMGGYGSWKLAARYPERFAAVVPICGGGEFLDVLFLMPIGKGPPEKVAALRSLGIWAFHGAKDPVVPLAESQRMVETFKQAGVTDIQLTVYPEALHDSFTVTYENPALYTWLLNHHREPFKP